MSGVRRFALPDLGEGLTEANVAAWHVAAGDEVALNQVLLEVETEKAVVELPSPFAGTVVELLAAAGESVEVGAPLIAIDTGDQESDDADGKVPMLVGYGPSDSPPSRRRRNGSGHRGPRAVGRTPRTRGPAVGGATGALHGTSARRGPGRGERPRARRDHHA